MQQHLPEQEVQRTGLSVQAPSSTNNDVLKIATLFRLHKGYERRGSIAKKKLWLLASRGLAPKQTDRQYTAGHKKRCEEWLVGG
jgi:hypothetical protein